MRFKELIKLRKLINNICGNYVFDDDEYEKFNEVLESQIIAVDSISELTSNKLVSMFGRCETPKE
jgi:hypothetical protein